MRFTQEAGSLFEEKTFRYIGSLAKLSELASKHSSEEVVTMRHVEDASRFLGTGPRKRLWVKACGVAGAMLFGTGLAQMVNMAGDDKYTGTGVWLSVILLVAGGLTAAYHVISE